MSGRAPLSAACFGILLIPSLVGCASGEAKPSDGAPAGDLALLDLAVLQDAPPADVLPPDLTWPSEGTSGPDAPPLPDLTQPSDVAPPPDVTPKPDSGPVVPKAPFTLDFEQTNGGLTGTKDWEWGKIAFQAGANCSGSTPDPPTAGHSGTGMWGTKLNDCYSPLGNADYSCSNDDTTDDSVLTLTFQLPPSFTTANLTYWEWTDFFLSYDWSEVYVNGQVAAQQCSGSTTAAWTKRVINLDSLIGQTVTVEFHFMATTVVQYAGWYIDDLSVSQLPP